jgi:hypothetical protein
MDPRLSMEGLKGMNIGELLFTALPEEAGEVRLPQGA